MISEPIIARPPTIEALVVCWVWLGEFLNLDNKLVKIKFGLAVDRYKDECHLVPTFHFPPMDAFANVKLLQNLDIHFLGDEDSMN